MQRNSLKIIILAVSTITIVLLTVGISSFAYFTAKKYVEEAYIDEMKKISRLAGKHIKFFFDQQTTLAEFVNSNVPFIKATISKDKGNLNPTLENVFKKYDTYENVFLSTPEVNPLVFADATGKAINFRWGGTGFDANIKAALEGKNLLSKVNRSPVTGEAVAVLTVPTKDGNQVVGILGFAISLSKMTETIVNGITIGSDGYIAITDLDGVVVGHPDKSLILKLDLSKTDWGKKLMTLPSEQHMEYFFKKEKIATVYDVPEYGLRVSAVVSKDELAEVVHQMLFRIIAFALVFLIVSIFVIYKIVNVRLHPLQEARELFRSMSTGDLTASLKIYHEDEIGDLSKDTNSFLESLRTSVRDIQKISQELAASAEELSASSENFSNGAQSTAASTEEMSATVEEMSAGMDNISGSIYNQYKNISEFQIKITELSQSVNQIGREVQDTLNMARSISLQAKKGEESLSGMNAMISNILKSSGEMTAIIGIINDISEQTQLLALNAAIEAARAGEAGKGFAVVAEEISKLSEKTASSIKSISAMITKNTGELDSGAKGIQASTEIIHAIIRNVDQVSGAMDRLYSITGSQTEINQAVTDNAGKVKTESEAVKLSTDEQKKAVSEISQVIMQINEHTINTASGAEQMSSSSRNLSNTAEILKNISEKFKL
ncbi:methyl-accepting chemotaxis protein [Leptospira hartskeerlii]|uniref:Methyl-accepting chemotaxis protein n=1 Tax=Leptospira hartskeerlii TaxID=2023177 RepID=A0A2M9XFY2_9LEPT|nr:methyl-accepting chemotaxis protein [Leptospira hartskeerlii]PJZ26621.1 methyl-accepting chemotaxis protein [Leptospira hartskeerlii]PJZ34896.1 methyl-accepting chemotaxis protein [Leptospira hartskeerlii]